MKLTQNTSFPVGLDISDLSLRFVQLCGKRENTKIQSIGAVGLSPGIIENGEIKKPELLVNALVDLLAKPRFGSVSTDEVVACLPEPKTFIKLIKINKTPNSLNDIIYNEIEKYIPIGINDIYLDWQVISENNDEFLVLVGASQKNVVNQYIQILNEANLSVKALEIESTAICRALLAEEKPKTTIEVPGNYGIVDIGAQRTSFIIYANRTVVLSISIPISGKEITEEIAQTLDINQEQAEKSKIICGLDKDKAQGIIYKILTGVLEKLNTRIMDTLEFYNSHYSHLPSLDRIILCGGGANIKNICPTMTETLKIETIEGNPFTNLSESKELFSTHFVENNHNKSKSPKNKTSEDSATGQDYSLSYTTAIGLALRNVFIDK